MQIKTDKEGAVAIRALCDIALRQGGLQAMGGIAEVLNCLDYPKPKPEPVPEPDKEPEKPEPTTPVPATKKTEKRLGKKKK